MEKRTGNASLSGGLIGFLIMVGAHLFAIFLGGGYNRWDFVVWLIQLAVYAFIANYAGEKQYQHTKDTYRSIKGVASAAAGAPVITSLMVWVFLLVRFFFLESYGRLVYLRGITIIFWIVVDVIMAFVIGNIVGKNVEKRHESFMSWH
jgi:hypothetical protein